ncbi:uncharacterized protein UV8b_03491 [Ustilaginoidea virens]|uniref:DUF6606 domain-containing protein n=1 Tax=Ustilaginoidea virens TaxID=1159556 RepID=A0A8E5HPG4_USTVR|nr:uncharacterized protein UV8b_03491 [Ustilaginoidea virens]QUC19250.1 hypothetical protein UV8b_03491 [Ustilaginoidea virens]
MWELSPNSEAVSGCKGRLKRYFPEVAVSIPDNEIKPPRFVDFLSHTLATLSHQDCKHMTPKLSAPERPTATDTTSPVLVTELLYAFLLSFPKARPGTMGVWKFTRDDVIMKSATTTPWRRSPLWLSLRVTLHLLLGSHEHQGANLYKKAMAHFMSCLLDSALKEKLKSETIFCMVKKLSRRVRKLVLTEDEPWMAVVSGILATATENMNQNWSRVILKNSRDMKLSSIAASKILRDTKLDLPGLDAFIAGIARRAQTTPSSVNPQSHLLSFLHTNLPTLEISELDKEYQNFNLFLFEAWVARSLDAWIDANTADINTCSQLCDLASQYFRIAVDLYRDNPMDISRMVLTILELWIACDKSALATNDQLHLFSPEIPSTIWDALLLSSKEDMQRLGKAERYLNSRYDAIKCETSIFDGIGARDSFVTKTFDKNESYQKSWQAKKKRADKCRQKKKEELCMMIEKYNSLMDVYIRGSCDFDEPELDGSEGEIRHSASCTRCRQKAEAERLKIDVLESPLPSNPDKYKAIVFELSPPLSFQAWRDFTYFFLTDVLSQSQQIERNDKKTAGSKVYLTDYANESGWTDLLASNARIMVILEEKKNFRPLKVHPELQLDQIFVDCTRRWRYVDTTTFKELSVIPPSALPQMCSVRLPASAATLQRFADQSAEQKASSLSNEAIAYQHRRPAHISSHEHTCMALLAQGHHTRWLNILQHLAIPKVDLKKPETALILLQVSCQAGTACATIARESHQLLECPIFTAKLLDVIGLWIEKIKTNWEYNTALWVLVMLITRVLSIGPSDVLGTATACLSMCRGIAFKWTEELQSKAAEETEGSRHAE